MMLSKKIMFAIVGNLLFFSLLLAQKPQKNGIIPIDSSYTVAHEWEQNHKIYPFISIVEDGDTRNLLIHNHITYTHYGERYLHLDVAQPKIIHGTKQPVVLIIHAGGWCSGTYQMDRPIAYELARHGFATVCAEYRMSPEAKYPAAIKDVETALRWIRAYAKQYHFDPNKVAILGSSAGGQLAALVGSLNTAYPTFETNAYKRCSVHVNAVVDMDGILTFIGHGSKEGKDQPGKLSCATRWFGVSMKINPAPYLQASALTHVNPHSAPFLFINSSLARMHAGRNALIAKLNQYGIYSEVHEIPNTPHTYWLFHPWFDEAMRYTINFLSKELFYNPIVQNNPRNP
ncbi:alpha/beta hydrolase [Microbacter margulisiae]|uniref:Pectinesterase n=1 Tax=Microbacter margulisiae TaxID=1350067 RepID=A0A7W5DRJ7_9PORP|nr:alpha/beta hydrolase [Microbacter margulisiae]MBB3187254.1 pectinesterase [Microbacter margulisiae]